MEASLGPIRRRLTVIDGSGIRLSETALHRSQASQVQFAMHPIYGRGQLRKSVPGLAGVSWKKQLHRNVLELCKTSCEFDH
jgi:hypothetical protein